jgi:hypothetical protein
MSELRQRQPRERDNKHLDYIRSLPCCICGGPAEPAHIRTPSLEHGKEHTGMAEKPSDKWVVPLCRPHHEEQHSMNEMDFWRCHQINPFILAMTLRGPHR